MLIIQYALLLISLYYIKNYVNFFLLYLFSTIIHYSLYFNKYDVINGVTKNAFYNF